MFGTLSVHLLVIEKKRHFTLKSSLCWHTTYFLACAHEGLFRSHSQIKKSDRRRQAAREISEKHVFVKFNLDWSLHPTCRLLFSIGDFDLNWPWNAQINRWVDLSVCAWISRHFFFRPYHILMGKVWYC